MKWVRAWRRADQDRTHVLQLAARVRGRAWGECCAAALLGVAVISSAVHGHVPAAACHFAQQRPSGGAAADASAAQASVAEADVDDADIMATLSFHMAELMEQVYRHCEVTPARGLIMCCVRRNVRRSSLQPMTGNSAASRPS